MKLLHIFCLLIIPHPPYWCWNFGALLDPDPPDQEQLPAMPNITPDPVADQPDQQTLLSNEDIVRLLMNHTSELLKDERQYTREAINDERELSNAKIVQVIEALADVAGSIDRSRRTNEASIDDINLKLETVATYYQEQLFNLKSGLLNTFKLVQQDMNVAWSRLQSLENVTLQHCTLSGKEFQGAEKLIEHVVTPHGNGECSCTSHNSSNKQCISGESHTQIGQDQINSGGILVQKCNFCGLSLPSLCDLESHLQSYHGALEHQDYLCYLCGKMVPSSNLEEHQLNSNCSPLLPDSNWRGMSETETPTMSCNSTTFNAIDELSPILQCDGNISIMSTDSDQPAHTGTPVVHHQDTLAGPPELNSGSLVSSFVRPPVEARKTGYTLDRSKQLKRLRTDTVLDNFNVEINSKNENVNIQCNLGFYSKVAKPALEDLAFGPPPIIGNITVKCHDITQRTDKSGAATTTVIMFRMNKDGNSMGQVTVHLHHTTRLIQLQGRSLLPDNTRAPVWFVENILLDRFNKQSKTHAHDIQELNDSVRDMVTRHLSHANTSSVCAGCKAKFTGRSSPEQCKDCRMFFHKSKCFHSTSHFCHTKNSSATSNTTVVYPLHTNVNPSSSNTTLPPPILTVTGGLTQPSEEEPDYTPHPIAQTTPLPLQSIHYKQAQGPSHRGSTAMSAKTRHSTSTITTRTSTSSTTTLTSISSINSWTSTSPTTTPTSTSITSTRPSISFPNVPPFQGTLSTLDPMATPFFGITSSEDNTTAAQGKGKCKCKNKPNKTNDDLALEYSKYQINVSQTKIREQEDTIKDLRFRNGILEARLVELEKKLKNDIYEKYFPSSTTDSNKTSQEAYNTHHVNTCPTATPHVVFPCCSTHTRQDTPHSSSLTEVTKRLDDLKQDIDTLKCSFNVLTDVSIPQIIRDVLPTLVLPQETPAPSAAKSRPVSSDPPPAQDEANISHITIDEENTSLTDLN